MERVDVVYALIKKKNEEKVLVVENAGSSWTFPGGAVETGESLGDAIVREVSEETGLEIKAGPVVAVNEKFFPEKKVHAIFFTLIAEIIGGKIAIEDETEISAIEWVDFQTANKLLPYHPEGVVSLLAYSAPYHLGL